MNTSRNTDISNVIIGVCFGSLIAVATCFVLMIFCFLVGLMGWSDGGDPTFLRRLELITKISFYTCVFLSGFVGGYLTGLWSQFKNSYLITTVILIILLATINKRDFSDLIPYLAVMVGIVFGGLFQYTRIKKNIITILPQS